MITLGQTINENINRMIIIIGDFNLLSLVKGTIEKWLEWVADTHNLTIFLDYIKLYIKGVNLKRPCRVGGIYANTQRLIESLNLLKYSKMKIFFRCHKKRQMGLFSDLMHITWFFVSSISHSIDKFNPLPIEIPPHYYSKLFTPSQADPGR